MIDKKMHSFGRVVAISELPPRFTYPFCYVPHPLCIEASALVKAYLDGRTDLQPELQHGKMLGVLVAEDADGDIGFLAAFSGNLAHSNVHDYFVPAVYDLLNPDGEFCRGEAEISSINHTISQMECDPEFDRLKQQTQAELHLLQSSLDEFKQQMKQEKAMRDAMRAAGTVSPEQEQQMIARSQFMKAELKRRKKAADEAVANSDASRRLLARETEIAELKILRKHKSASLQQRLFELFVVQNAVGLKSDLVDIFRPTAQGTPPAGAGECAAPKLLQYALANGLKPRTMAEFWMGQSPVAEIRHDGNFYPACRSKCLPILTFMLQGLDVDDNPLAVPSGSHLTVVYNDQWLTIVDKPSGLLTVPGKLHTDSLLSRYQAMFPEAEGPMIVHRLDMATSGLVVIAKTKEVHKSLQSQFADRRITKVYEALLDGVVGEREGTISLPIRPNPDDRPHQMVDVVNGKSAVTQYRVMSIADGVTRIEFTPHTGRTHQLRVHSAHHLGLNAPILGDPLYGRHSTNHTSRGELKHQRLCLHARSLAFKHPVTGELVTATSPTPF